MRKRDRKRDHFVRRLRHLSSSLSLPADVEVMHVYAAGGHLSTPCVEVALRWNRRDLRPLYAVELFGLDESAAPDVHLVRRLYWLSAALTAAPEDTQ